MLLFLVLLLSQQKRNSMYDKRNFYIVTAKGEDKKAGFFVNDIIELDKNYMSYMCCVHNWTEEIIRGKKESYALIPLISDFFKDGIFPLFPEVFIPIWIRRSSVF